MLVRRSAVGQPYSFQIVRGLAPTLSPIREDSTHSHDQESNSLHDLETLPKKQTICPEWPMAVRLREE